MGNRIERFEDLIAWQKARFLAREIYKTTEDGHIARDLGLSGQMRRAAVSVMSNIAEGFERSSPGEFHHFLLIAKSSCAELRSQLYLAFDVGHMRKARFDELFAMAEELSRIIGGLRASVKRRLVSKTRS
jgi:four helix bundle protein